MNTNAIVDRINADFTKTYTNASSLQDSGELWNFCIRTIQDPVKLAGIVSANDQGVPPVQSLLQLYVSEYGSSLNLTKKQAPYLGKLMAFIFKHVLGYKGQKDNVSVNKLGIGTAARYFDGPAHDFYCE